MAVHAGVPYGRLCRIAPKTAAISPPVCGWLTQSRRRFTGHWQIGIRGTSAVAGCSGWPRLDHRQFSARLTSFARSGLRSTYDLSR